jgi:hypothetical protein
MRPSARYGAVAASCERAPQPREDARRVRRARAHEHERDECGEERGKRNSGEDQSLGIDAAPAAREERHEHGRAHAGREADGRHERRRDPEGDADCDRRARARAHAGEERVHERVAQEPLQERPGDAERHPDTGTDDDTRGAEQPDDRAGVALFGGICEYAQ